MTRLLAIGIAPEWSLHVRMPRVVFLDFLARMIYRQTLGTREENTVTNSELYGSLFLPYFPMNMSPFLEALKRWFILFKFNFS